MLQLARVQSKSISVTKWRFACRVCACLHTCVCSLLHNCTFVIVSLCVHLDCLCASSCVIKHGGVSVCAHYSPLSSISLAALRHYPSAHSLYEYLTSPQASLLSFHAPPSIPLLFLLSSVIPFCRCCTHLSVSVSLWNACKSFLPLSLSCSVCLSLSLFQHIICSSLQWGRKLLLQTLPLNAQSLFLI